MFDRAKKALGLGSDDDKPNLDDVDVETDFETEKESDGITQVEDESSDVDDEDDEMMEWENAYKFAEWYLEDEGFANMRDFGERAMMHRLQRSPMFRDRIQTGLDTLNNISSAKQQLDEIKGKNKRSDDLDEMAEKVENAQTVIQGVRKMSGEDEMIVQQGMSLARDAIGAIAQGGSGESRSVDTGIERTEEEI